MRRVRGERYGEDDDDRDVRPLAGGNLTRHPLFVPLVIVGAVVGVMMLVGVVAIMARASRPGDSLEQQASGWDLREFRDYVNAHGFPDPGYKDTFFVYFSASIPPGEIDNYLGTHSATKNILKESDGVRVTKWSGIPSAEKAQAESKFYAFRFSGFVAESRCKPKLIDLARALDIDPTRVSSPR